MMIQCSVLFSHHLNFLFSCKLLSTILTLLKIFWLLVLILLTNAGTSWTITTVSSLFLFLIQPSSSSFKYLLCLSILILLPFPSSLPHLRLCLSFLSSLSLPPLHLSIDWLSPPLPPDSEASHQPWEAEEDCDPSDPEGEPRGWCQGWTSSRDLVDPQEQEGEQDSKYQI